MALYRGQGQGGSVSWVKVSSHMGGTRSYVQCNRRWHETLNLSDSGLVKEGAWAEDEVSVIHATITHVDCWLCNKCNLHSTHCNHIVFQCPLCSSK